MNSFTQQDPHSRIGDASLLVAGVSLAILAGCGSGDAAGRCQIQSSSSSGGICRLDLACGGWELAASCSDVDCACIVNGASTGQRFIANGFCGQPEAEQGRLVEANCVLPSDAGGKAADGGIDPRCPSLVNTGMACGAGDLNLTCPGTAACFCNKPVNISTTCVCKEGTAFGRAWRCTDDCQSACSADAGAPKLDQGALKPDTAAGGTACFAEPQCIASTTGSSASIALIASVCSKVSGKAVTTCATSHHDQCVVAAQEIVIYTDKNHPLYDPLSSKAGCDQLGGGFIP